MMQAPRLLIDLEKIEHNARLLVARLSSLGISVTGVTKATLGSPEVAASMLWAGIDNLGDSRLENIEKMRHAGIVAPITLIRTPMPSQLDRVVAHADISFNTELDVISGLSLAARKAKRSHGVVLMVELGDLREGILVKDIETVVQHTLQFPNIKLMGIGANFACRSGVAPDNEKMAELSKLADTLDARLGPLTYLISGGNSANLRWAFNNQNIGRINNLRLGEAILLGCEPLHRQNITGLHSDAITLTAEVIEAKSKPTLPWGQIAQTAFGKIEKPVDRGHILQTIVAIGHQDVDPDGLSPIDGSHIIGASSDHLIMDTGGRHLRPGATIDFRLNYAAMLRAMTSPHIIKIYQNRSQSSASRASISKASIH